MDEDRLLALAHLVYEKIDQGEMQKLDPEQRAVMELICIEGHSYMEVALILDIPMGMVTSRLARGVHRAQEGDV